MSKPVLKKGIPGEYHLAGTCAHSCLDSMCEKLSSGEITNEELEKIDENREQMKRLCLAVSSTGGGGNELYLSVETAVSNRLEEWQKYRHRSKVLMHLCHHIRSVCRSVQGIY